MATTNPQLGCHSGPGPTLSWDATQDTHPPTWTMLGCDSDVLMAASIMAMRSRFSIPLLPLGSTIRLTATDVPLQLPM